MLQRPAGAGLAAGFSQVRQALARRDDAGVAALQAGLVREGQAALRHTQQQATERRGQAELAAATVLREGSQIPRFLERFVHAGLLGRSDQRALQAHLTALGARASVQSLATHMPHQLALFLARVRLAESEAVLEVLLKWGEALREEAARAKVAAERNRQASLVIKQGQASSELNARRMLEQQLNEVERSIARKRRELAGKNGPELRALARALNVEAAEPERLAAPTYPSRLPALSGRANASLLGALPRPWAEVALPLGRSPSAWHLQIVARGLAATGW